MTNWTDPSDELRADRRAILQATLIAGLILVVLAAFAQAYGVFPEPEVSQVEVSPSEAYYGPTPDTSAIARLCCRVLP